MSNDDEQRVLRYLLVDDQHFQRRLLSETLRSFGPAHIEQAESAEQCIDALAYFAPDILITDWDMTGGDGVWLVKRLRSGAVGSAYKKLPVIMVAERNRARDVEAARNAGIDEFLLRPFTAGGLRARVDAVQVRRRDFVETGLYTGPCRRRRRPETYDGPMRRLFDVSDIDADTPEVQIKKGLARMYAERIMGLLPKARPDNRDGMRDLYLACAQLRALTEDLGERLLITASESLLQYVRGVGAEGALNTDVIRAHLDALVQLAELPNSKAEMRQTVTHELGVMVSKKLRTGAQPQEI